jgi:hypothetical protein
MNPQRIQTHRLIPFLMLALGLASGCIIDENYHVDGPWAEQKGGTSGSSSSCQYERTVCHGPVCVDESSDECGLTQPEDASTSFSGDPALKPSESSVDEPVSDPAPREEEPCPEENCAEIDRCVFNGECGGAGLCVDGQCQSACVESVECATGYVCSRGLCAIAPSGGGECVYNAECDGGVCQNGFCLSRCTDGSACGPSEVCREEICRADTAPQPECRATSQCRGAFICQDARCRQACVCDADCGMGASCSSGACVPDREASPECTHSAHCDQDLQCVDGACA